MDIMAERRELVGIAISHSLKFDLAIITAVLAAQGVFRAEDLRRTTHWASLVRTVGCGRTRHPASDSGGSAGRLHDDIGKSRR